MPRPHSHLFHVTMEVDALSGPATELVLPSWTPGSYMIREFARHVQEFSAEAAGEPLRWCKTAKDAWRVENGGAPSIRVRYRVYAHDLTVRTCHLDATHGYLNGAAVFMFLPERTHEPVSLRVRTPEGWEVATGLAAAGSPAADCFDFVASGYDELVDCPLECGTHRTLTFDVDGVEHRVAVWGRGNEDLPRFSTDLRRIVEASRSIFGQLPYPHYTFILHLAEGRGGLEHRNSTSLLVNRFSFHPRAAYESLLSLAAHEHFHVWNVKRIRPAALGTLDYRRENVTRLLWAMEGVTSYYDDQLLLRAGVIGPERFLAIVAEDVLSLESQPGRTLQSLEEASFDAWIKHYRPDENTANSSISYYLKGSLVALLLDLEIRHRTRGERSLDDVLRLLHDRFPIGGSGIPEEGAYLAAVEDAAGQADGVFRRFFAKFIAGTEPLDYSTGLAHAGIRCEWRHGKEARGGGPPGWLGMRLKGNGIRAAVASVRSDGPACAAGIYPGDELVALDGFRIDETTLAARLAERVPGDHVRLTLFRRDELLEVQVPVAASPPDTLKLVRIEDPDPLQMMIRARWLGPEETP